MTAISPTSGSVGTTVTITGTNFTGATGVFFGAAAAGSFTVNSSTQITATAPAGSGIVDITVTTSVGTSAIAAADKFNYSTSAPGVTSVSPNTGSAGGGTSVIITGSNFTGASAVYFGANNATAFTVNSVTQITATAPAGTGVVAVTVVTANGTSATSSADQFTYVAAPTVTGLSPNSCPAPGGGSVIITGTGFTGFTVITAVHFGANIATMFTVNSATQITAMEPAGTGTVDVTVTSLLGGTSATSSVDQFTYGVLSSWLVTNTSNSASISGSLPWAVAQANSDPSNANITFSPTAFPSATTITLASTLTLSNAALSMTIDGSGAGPITVSGGGSVQILAVNTSVHATITSLTLMDGTFASAGGAVSSLGSLTVNDCTISDSTCTDGNGGGIAVSSLGSLTVNDCTISDNTCTDGDGGGIYAGGPTAIVNSTITGNSAAGAGGGIATNNLPNQILTVTNCTFSGNNGGSAAGGVDIGSGTTATLYNSIVAANSVSGTENDISGTVVGIDNLIGSGSGESGLVNGINGNQVGTSSSPINPLLNALANNGGPTQTMPEQIGSPAIGAGGAVMALANAVADTASTSITISTDYAIFILQTLPLLSSGSYFTIQIGSEQLAVNGLTLASSTTAILTVGRGVNGTTAATHSAGALIYLVGDQRGYLAAFNNTAVVDIGADESTGTITTPPTVTSVSPDAGNAGGGTTVTITGTGFTGATAVSFGTNPTGNIVANPTFSTGSFAPWIFVPASQGSLCEVIAQYPYPTTGTYSAVFGANEGLPDTIEQTLATTPGQTYTFSYWIYHPYSDEGQSISFESTWGGNVVQNLTSATFADYSTYTQFSYQETATSSTTVITLGGYEEYLYFWLDDVSVSSNVGGPGIPAESYTVNSNTQITAVSPPGSGTVDVTVTVPGQGLSATTSSDQFTYLIAPTVTSLSPNNGPAAGGTSITIAGTGFTGASAVNFGGTEAMSFTVDSDTQITAIAPAGSGEVDVTVITAGGTSATSSADQFTYDVPTTTSVASNPVGPITQGTSITFTATISNADPGTVSFYFDYGAADQFQIGGAINVSSGSATSYATTALPAGADPITAIYSGGVGFDGSQGTLTIQVVALPPTIANVVINQDIPALDDAAGQPTPGTQRSMVDDIVYTFSEPVDILNSSIDPNVFTVAVAPGWTGIVPTIIEWSPLAGSVNSQWKVDFSGASISNGAYTITVTDPAAITAESDGQALSLAPSGIGGATQSFYRLYGDINGDEVVNAADNLRFKQALATYNVAFDINQDGYVNAYDSSYFKQDLTLSFTGFTPTI